MTSPALSLQSLPQNGVQLIVAPLLESHEQFQAGYHSLSSCNYLLVVKEWSCVSCDHEALESCKFYETLLPFERQCSKVVETVIQHVAM